MDNLPATPRAHPRHLLSPQQLTDAAAVHLGTDVDLEQGRGDGNGLRVHGIYFVVVSLTVLVAFIAAVIVLANTMM